MSVQYKYTAFDTDGEIQAGSITASSNEQAVEFLSERHLRPINLTEIKENKALSFWGYFKKQDYENLIAFTQNFSTLYKAGIPMLRILSLIKVGPETGAFNRALSDISHQLQAGKSLSAAMAEHKGLFTDVYLACISAGEESGQLDKILDELGPMLENELELTRDIKSGIRYPLLVISSVAIAFAVLMIFVIPKFVAFFGAFGSDLPLPTKIVMGFSAFITTYWPLLLTFMVASVYGFIKLTRNPAGRLWVDRKFLQIPILNQIIIKGSIARFAMMFSILFKAGIPIVRVVGLLKESIKNSAISAEIGKLEGMFREGQEHRMISEEFEYFPDMALQMMQIGLESGSLDQILEEIGRHYSKEVRYTSRNLTAILEPILTFVLGGFILILALAIFLPMWNLIKVFKG